MSDYISREAAIELGYWHGEKPTVDNPFPDGVDAVDTVDIENLPAADVREVKRGKWKYTEMYYDDYAWVCSVCGEPWVLNDGTPAENNMNYCPNCGADMREEQT